MGGDERNDGRPAIVQRLRNAPFEGAAKPAVEAATPAPPPARAEGVVPRPPADARPRDGFAEDARFGELYLMFIVNLLLGLLTLGIYRFWGKTRIRKYVWSHISFRGERFEYGGTGLEMFIGFVLALLIFGPPFFGASILIQLEPIPNPNDTERFARYILWLYGIVFGLLMIAFYFGHVAVFSAYRYRVTRSLWHGIRGTVDGNAWVYGFIGFGLSLLNGLSLGWTQPWSHTVLLNYRFERTKIGTHPVKGTMTVKGLYGPYTFAWVASFVVGIVVIAAIVALIATVSAGSRPPDFDSLGGVALIVLAYIAIPATWYITVNWYRAALIRKVATTYTVDTLDFAFPVRGGALLRFSLGNTLILLLTLGLLYPYIVLRYARFIQRHLTVAGDIDAKSWRQSGDWRPSTGEGMAEFFGIGVI